MVSVICKDNLNKIILQENILDILHWIYFFL